MFQKIDILSNYVLRYHNYIYTFSSSLLIMETRIDYSIFSDMKEHEIRAEITRHVCETERFRPEYSHLNTQTLIEKFNQICQTDSKGVMIITSRPFANINNLNAANANVPITKVMRGGWWNSYRDVHEKDERGQQEVRNTFNGPALISNLLPPSDHLAGKFGHPSLTSGKTSAWKEVIGKIEDIRSNLPHAFFYKEDGIGKKAEKREHERLHEVTNYTESYVDTVLGSFGERNGYPGGLQVLGQRCFSVYFVKMRRSEKTGKVHGYAVRWIADYTHKGDQGWTKKGDKVTVPIPEYLIYTHDDGTSFAGWNMKLLKAQVDEYEKEEP